MKKRNVKNLLRVMCLSVVTCSRFLLQGAEGEEILLSPDQSDQPQTQELIEQEQEEQERMQEHMEEPSDAPLRTGRLIEQLPRGQATAEQTPRSSIMVMLPLDIPSTTSSGVVQAPALYSSLTIGSAPQEARLSSDVLATRIENVLHNIRTLSPQAINDSIENLKNYYIDDEDPDTVLEHFDTIKAMVESALARAAQAGHKQAIKQLVDLQLATVYKDRRIRYALVVSEAGLVLKKILPATLTGSTPEQLAQLRAQLDLLNEQLSYLKDGFATDIYRIVGPNYSNIYNQFTKNEDALLQGIGVPYTAQQLYKLLGLSDYATTQEVKDAVVKIVAAHPTEKIDSLGLAAREAGNLIGNQISKAFYDAYLTAEGDEGIEKFNTALQITQEALESSSEKSQEAAQLQNSITDTMVNVEKAIADNYYTMPHEQLIRVQPNNLGLFARVEQDWANLLTTLTPILKSKIVPQTSRTVLVEASRRIADVHKTIEDERTNTMFLLSQTEELLNELANERMTIDNISKYQGPHESLLSLERVVLKDLQARLSRQRALLEDIQRGFRKQVANADIRTVSDQLTQAINSYPKKKQHDATYSDLVNLQKQARTLGLEKLPQLIRQLGPVITRLKKQEQVVVDLLNSPLLQSAA